MRFLLFFLVNREFTVKTDKSGYRQNQANGMVEILLTKCCKKLIVDPIELSIAISLQINYKKFSVFLTKTYTYKMNLFGNKR